MEAEQIRRLDVIHHIQDLRARRSQKVLPDDHYIWNSLNQNHYDFLHTLKTTPSYNIDINQFNIIGEVGGQIAQEVNGEFMEQIEADIAAREDEEENRVLPQSSAGIADSFDDLSVQNLVEEFTVADHSNVETLQRRNRHDDDNNNGDIQHLFANIAFYIRQAKIPREAMEAHLRQYCIDFPADSQWATHFMGKFTADPGNPQFIYIHYAGMTSQTLQQRIDQDSPVSASKNRSRLLNFNEIANPDWTIQEVTQIAIPPFQGNDLVQHVMNIGYIEDILIKALGPFQLNRANGGFLVDWDPTAIDIAMAREFLNNTNGWEIARKQRLTISDADLVAPVDAHMRDYFQFTANNRMNQPIDPEAQGRLLRDTTMQAVNFGFVKSVTLSDDASLVSLREGKAFYSDEQDLYHGPTFARHMSRKIGLLTGDIQTFNEEDPALYRPFIDMFGFSKQLMMAVAIPFTSRYLALVQPDIIVSSSATVLGTFMRDSFQQYWKSGDPQDDIVVSQFYGATNTVTTLDHLQAMSTGSVYGLRSVVCSNVTKHTGEVYLANYSPYDRDVCLLFVERHSGALKYDPEFQPLYCKERFLTSLLLERLESIVQEQKRGAGPRLMNADAKRAFFLEIKNIYQEEVRGTAVYQELQNLKRSIIQLQETLMRQRGITRVQRQARRQREVEVVEADIPAQGTVNISRRARLGTRQVTRRVETTRISVTFDGPPNSEERIIQLNQVMQSYLRMVENGLIGSMSFPMPRTVPSVDSEEYRRWFLSAGQNADIIRSAAATGTNSYQSLSPEQKDHWLRVRGFGRFGVPPPEQLSPFPNAKKPAALFLDLCDSDKYSATNSHFVYVRLHCKHCRQSCAADRNTQHRCIERDNTILPRNEENFVQFRLIYPHDLIAEQLYDIEDEVAQESMQAHAINSTICRRYLENNDFPGIDVPADVPELSQRIFFQTNTTIAVHRNAMALDIWLKQACRASRFNPPGSIQDEVVSDSWFFDAAMTKQAIKKYFKRDSGHHNIRLHENYCQCGYYGIRLPCLASKINTPNYQLYQQHKCRNNHSRKVACAFGASAGRINELPYPAARYVLYLFSTAPAEYLNPFLWRATEVPRRRLAA